jgi:hypothetical protein
LRKARGSPGERGPQGSQRAPDIDLAADERRLGGAPIRQILGEGNRASRRTPRSRKGKGMPETVTWRILGTSLQRTSSDDRSDLTVASARSRSSSQDKSSCSSSRTKTGSEASRVRNRSNWHRPRGSAAQRQGCRPAERIARPRPPLPRHWVPAHQPPRHWQQPVVLRPGRRRLRWRQASAWPAQQPGPGPWRRQPPPQSRWPPRQKSPPREPAPQRRATPEPPEVKRPTKGSAERQGPGRRWPHRPTP